MSVKTRAKKSLHAAAYHAESVFDRVRRQIKAPFKRKQPLTIVPYHGYANGQRAWAQGRVLHDDLPGGPRDDDTWWENLLAMWKRWETDEMPDVAVEGTLHGHTVAGVTDSEGYYLLEFELNEPLPRDRDWHDVSLRITDRRQPDGSQPTAQGQVLFPTAEAEYLVVSDMDDTVLKSHATNAWKMAKLTFLNNAKTRVPFEGVAKFYQALRRGNAAADAPSPNPIFYVSSSAWNLYDLFVDFLELQEIPAGPIHLQEVGITREKFIKGGHGHKLDKIEELMEVYPDLKFVLIGDSGQKDPELYQEAVEKNPDRVRAIFIRDVVEGRRDEVVHGIARDVERHGVTMKLVLDSAAAAQHAADMGLIRPEAIEAVRQEVSADRERG